MVTRILDVVKAAAQLPTKAKRVKNPFTQEQRLAAAKRYLVSTGFPENDLIIQHNGDTRSTSIDGLINTTDKFRLTQIIEAINLGLLADRPTIYTFEDLQSGGKTYVSTPEGSTKN